MLIDELGKMKILDAKEAIKQIYQQKDESIQNKMLQQLRQLTTQVYSLKYQQTRSNKIFAKIRIHYYTLPGQKIMMTGNMKFLGLWDPLKGIQMEYIKEGYWEANIQLATITSWEYKFVCVQENGEAGWEQGENRIFPPENVLPTFSLYGKYFYCVESWNSNMAVH